MDTIEVTADFARLFLDSYHPLKSGGCLRGLAHAFAGYENGWPTFVAVFVHPRSRWKHYPVVLELSRLAWSPMAIRSASTFLRKCLRLLKRHYDGLVVTYALPGTSGIVYERAGFYRDGHSSGSPWSRRGADSGERPTPDTVGTGRNLKRFFAEL